MTPASVMRHTGSTTRSFTGQVSGWWGGGQTGKKTLQEELCQQQPPPAEIWLIILPRPVCPPLENCAEPPRFTCFLLLFFNLLENTLILHIHSGIHYSMDETGGETGGKI